MNIFDTLKKLKLKDEERKQPMHIYKDENTGQIIEEPLSSMDMAGSALINRTDYKNPAKLIHDSIFGN
jgi:hypothetical protein